MEFFKPGVTYDFFRYRWPFIFTSVGLCVLSLISLFVPGPKFGIDFKGGTEVELALNGSVSSSDLRKAVVELGFGQPDVIAMQGVKNHYLLRLDQVSSLSPAQIDKARKNLDTSLGDAKLLEMK